MYASSTAPYRYLELCDNPGYAIGNNRGVQELASPDSRWVLFLNDDVVLQPNFLQRMLDLADAKHAKAVGCKVLSSDGSKLIEAGSIVWNQASCAGFGRDRTDVNASEFTYARPVDYVSGACLLFDKDAFLSYGGFDHARFPNYYEDTDLQMHVQHDLKSEIWFQPLAIAYHAEHGSFGTSDSVRLMENGARVFHNKWKPYLKQHLPPPRNEQELPGRLLLASDRRSRRPHKYNILYVDDRIPNGKNGAGYGRSFDNLSILLELGHRVTATSLITDEAFCDESCRSSIEQNGIEVVVPTVLPLRELLRSRPGFYHVVVVSRPSTFGGVHEVLREAYQGEHGPFSIMYDCEALWYRRDETLEAQFKEGIRFPGAIERGLDKPSWGLVSKVEREREVTWLNMADVIIAVSDHERKFVAKAMPPGSSVSSYTIGHTMKPSEPSETGYLDREGILFLGAFHKQMYYNGDALWYFLTQVYPFVVKEKQIPFYIAGRGIPQDLRDIVSRNPLLEKTVTFYESPKSLKALYEKARIFIAPHQYGAGIQYKLSEAFAKGIPVVMSSSAAMNFGLTESSNVGCVGSDTLSFKKCIIKIHENPAEWEFMRQSGLDFIERTHARSLLANRLEDAISTAVSNLQRRKECGSRCPEHGLISTPLPFATEPCPEGEDLYISTYPDVGQAVKDGAFPSAFRHWKDFGAAEGRVYGCYSSGGDTRQ